MWAQGRPGEDKALSIVLRFPSTLFLNHPGLNVPFYLTGPLPFQYIQHEPALNKHLPASCSAARESYPHLSKPIAKVFITVCSERVEESLSLLMAAPLSFPHLKKALLSVITSLPLFFLVRSQLLQVLTKTINLVGGGGGP